VTWVAFAIPGDLMTMTGGYAYDREVLKRLPEFGIDAVHLALPGGFPDPSQAEINETRRALGAQPSGTVLLIDGLAYGAFPPELAKAFAGRIVALVHHPLGIETGLTESRAAALCANEQAVLSHAAAVIVTGPETATLLARDFAVAPDKITVAVPGVERSTRAIGSSTGEPVQLLAVGSLVPRKGYDVLIRALQPLAGLAWQLTIVGEERTPGLRAQLETQIAEAGLSGRITLAGGMDESRLALQFMHADIFVMSSHYEGYGMVLTEALVRGLPVVATLSGAGAAMLPTSAAIGVPVGDSAALGDALSDVISNYTRRRTMADAAWAAADDLPRWEMTAQIIAGTCKRVSLKDVK
jgi:glycosyltransferase involved in cell wall biosynthesis